MTALLAQAPAVEPISILRGLDPILVLTEYPDSPLVYLIHLDKPFAMGRFVFRHYIGWTGPGNLPQRMIGHRTGKGSKFLRAAGRSGCTWHLARVWVGDTREERRIKNMGGASRSCPSCGIIPAAERQLLRDARGRYIHVERSLP